MINPIALNDTYVLDHFVALSGHGVAEGNFHHAQQAWNNFHHVAAIRTEHHLATRGDNHVTELSAQKLGAAIDIATVDDDGHDRTTYSHIGQNVAKVSLFTFFIKTKRTFDAVLSCGHRVGGHCFAVDLVCGDDTFVGIGTHEAHSVSGTADFGLFSASDTTTAEVMQREHQQRHIGTGQFVVVLDSLLDFVVHRCDGGWIPDTTENQRLEICGHPE